MQTECSAEPIAFGRVEGRAVVAEFKGRALTSDAGGLLLGAADRAWIWFDGFSPCFRDARDPRFVERYGNIAHEPAATEALGVPSWRWLELGCRSLWVAQPH